MPTPLDLFRFWAVGNLWFCITAWQRWDRNTRLAIDVTERIAEINNRFIRHRFGVSEDERVLLSPAVIAELKRRSPDLRKRRMESV